jgi:exopolysaccharide biosynthesis protein
MRGVIATVNLADERIEVVVSPPHPLAAEAEAVLFPVTQWAIHADMDLAINANFFALTGPDAKAGYRAGAAADILGLCVSGGEVVSPARTFEGQADPAILIMPDGTARVGCFAPGEEMGALAAVAGIGASKTDTRRGGLLVTGGKSQAADARVDPLIRHPRTAIGVKSDSRTLVLIVIDGRQPGWSDGATLEELAEVLIEAGVVDAVNLDGGGSTTMVWREPGTQSRRTNRASGVSGFRPVANALGIRVRPAAR